MNNLIIIRKDTIVASLILFCGFFLIGSIYFLNGRYYGPYLTFEKGKIGDYTPNSIPHYTYDNLPLYLRLRRNENNNNYN